MADLRFRKWRKETLLPRRFEHRVHLHVCNNDHKSHLVLYLQPRIQAPFVALPQMPVLREKRVVQYGEFVRVVFGRVRPKEPTSEWVPKVHAAEVRDE